jgi:hypothetical protein
LTTLVGRGRLIAAGGAVEVAKKSADVTIIAAYGRLQSCVLSKLGKKGGVEQLDAPTLRRSGLTAWPR